MTDTALEAFSDTSFCGFGLGPQCGVNVQPEHNYAGMLFTPEEPLAVLNGTGVIAQQRETGRAALLFLGFTRSFRLLHRIYLYTHALNLLLSLFGKESLSLET